jgi:hypothetical protein
VDGLTISVMVFSHRSHSIGSTKVVVLRLLPERSPPQGDSVARNRHQETQGFIPDRSCALRTSFKGIHEQCGLEMLPVLLPFCTIPLPSARTSRPSRIRARILSAPPAPILFPIRQLGRYARSTRAVPQHRTHNMHSAHPRIDTFTALIHPTFQHILENTTPTPHYTKKHHQAFPPPSPRYPSPARPDEPSHPLASPSQHPGMPSLTAISLTAPAHKHYLHTRGFFRMRFYAASLVLWRSGCGSAKRIRYVM